MNEQIKEQLGMKTKYTIIKGVEVELQFGVGVGAGLAVHEVLTDDLNDGSAKGPNDGQDFLFEGKWYELGEHSYERSAENKTSCYANFYERQSHLE